MVAKIISGKNIRGLLLYNENKVGEGSANLILANRFGMELDRLDFNAKLTRFGHLTSLRPDVKTNALHIMLNFDRSEKIDNARLQQIAMNYLDKIGFGEQPYLVYRHKDVSHPHIHIVTTNIKPDAKRIDIHGIGWKLSETARKEIETEFGLIKAEGRNYSEALSIPPVDIEKAIYGKAPTKRAINNVVSSVLRSYKFTSLAEYNAVLKQFNVVADRGKEDTVMFEKRGLVYSIIDLEGRRIGIPFKASDLTDRPKLDKVEKKFERSRETRKTFRSSIAERIEKVLNRYNAITMDTFRSELQKYQIALLPRVNEQGIIYGMTFIDHKTKCVFNGSDIGKAYSAKAIMERLRNADIPKQYLTNKTETEYIKRGQPEKTYLDMPEPVRILEIALSKEGYVQAAVFVKRKKRRKKQQQIDPQQGL